ncbi:hypothetical protein EJB05_52005, partial [Eragrostis curvula]
MCEVGDCEVHGGSSEIHGVLRPPRTAPLPNGGNFFCTSRSTATEATRSTSSSIPCSVMFDPAIHTTDQMGLKFPGRNRDAIFLLQYDICMDSKG